MVIPAFVPVLVAVLSIAGGIAIAFWNKILEWASSTLFPWIQKNVPSLEGIVKEAFWELDQVIGRTRRTIKEAWEKLRKYLLKVLVQFERNTQNKWVKRITYWAMRTLESQQVVRVVAEEIVDVDSLPPDVREEWLKRGNTTQDINVTQLRDRELELAMTY